MIAVALVCQGRHQPIMKLLKAAVKVKLMAISNEPAECMSECALSHLVGK